MKELTGQWHFTGRPVGAPFFGEAIVDFVEVKGFIRGSWRQLRSPRTGRPPEARDVSGGRITLVETRNLSPRTVILRFFREDPGSGFRADFVGTFNVNSGQISGTFRNNHGASGQFEMVRYEKT